MENSAWRAKPFPDDLYALMDDLLPGPDDRGFGDNWPELRKSCSLIIAVVAADLASRGPACPLSPTYGDLCRLFSTGPKNTEAWITGIANSTRVPPISPAFAENARAILSVPPKHRKLLFTLMA
jgi:hypothetical protein